MTNIETILQSAYISLVGMILVFIAIFIIWIGISALVRFTQRSAPTDQINDLEENTISEAAAAAVIVALQAREYQKQPVPQLALPDTVLVSAWQAVMRAHNFSKRGRIR